MAEIWDAYDRNFHRVEGVRFVRGEAIPEGIYHLVCEVVVKHKDGAYLLMQRAPEKHLGGMWELTAGGSALAGETPIACAVKELREETGIQSSDLQQIGRVIQDGNRSLYVEYLCITDGDKNAIVLQEGETVDYKWVDKATLLEMGTDVLISSRMLKLVKEFSI